MPTTITISPEGTGKTLPNLDTNFGLCKSKILTRCPYLRGIKSEIFNLVTSEPVTDESLGKTEVRVVNVQPTLQKVAVIQSGMTCDNCHV